MFPVGDEQRWWVEFLLCLVFPLATLLFSASFYKQHLNALLTNTKCFALTELWNSHLFFITEFSRNINNNTNDSFKWEWMFKLSNSFCVAGLRKIEDVNLGRQKLFTAPCRRKRSRMTRNFNYKFLSKRKLKNVGDELEFCSFAAILTSDKAFIAKRDKIHERWENMKQI